MQLINYNMPVQVDYSPPVFYFQFFDQNLKKGLQFYIASCIIVTSKGTSDRKKKGRK